MLIELIIAATVLFIAFFCFKVVQYTKVTNYLYPNVTKHTIQMSNVGAMLSFYTMIIGSILTSLGWGSLIVIISVISMYVGFSILKKMMIIYVDKNPENINHHYSIAEFLYHKKNITVSYLLITLMTVFSLLTIVAEIESINIFINALLSSEEELNQGKIINSNKTINYGYFLYISCFLYVLFAGYAGILKTDKYQMYSICLLWVAVVLSYFLFADSPFLFWQLLIDNFDFDGGVVLTSFATATLVIAWIIGAKDNWVRVFLYLDQNNAQQIRSKESQKKYISQVINRTRFAGIAIVIIPLLTGLYLRDYIKNNVTNCSAPIVSEYKNGYKPLSAKLIDNSCDYKPTHQERGEKYIEEFTNFSNFPYIHFARKIQQIQNFTLYELSILALFMLAIFAMALTTIDTLFILFSQLLGKLVKERKKVGVFYYLSNAKVQLTLFFLLGGIIIWLHSLPSQNAEEFYLSTGVFAWSNLIFVAFIQVFIIKTQNYQSLKIMPLVWGVWLLFPLVHFFELVSNINDFPFQDIVRMRSIMVGFAVMLCVIVFLSHIPSLLKPILKNKTKAKNV